jgi:gamma-glutamyltranspeptidase/glutathione hydrolase
LKRAVLAAFLFVLCSCGEGPTDSGAASREGTQSQTPRVEETTRAISPRETTAPADKTPAATDAEPRENLATSSTPTRAAVGTDGMISSAHPLATRAGLEVLEDGGNTFDAAIAVAASLSVVEPYMSGIGGSGAMVVYHAGSSETRYLSAATRAPETLDPGVFRPTEPGYLENRQGAPAVTTPGAVNDWVALWREYGELRWSRLLEPAISQAEEGFVLDRENAGWIGSEFYTFPRHAREIYGDGGTPLVAGERLVQEDLGRSLRLISEEGAGAVYDGELGTAMASAAQRNGGFLTTEDLKSNRVLSRKTISVDYRGNTVVTAPPPTTAWNALTRLGVMSRLDPTSLGHNSAAYLDTYAVVTEQAYYERFDYAADPEISPTPLDRLLSQTYFEQQAANVSASASPAATSLSPRAPRESASVGETNLAKKTGHTTHFVVADAEGNVVSATQTLGDIFGSRVMPKGTGIWLNNGIYYSTFEPEGNPLDVFPGRFRLSGIAPTLVMRDGRPWAAIGTHGGYYILQTTPQMLMNLIDFEMDVQEAISAPRISFVAPGSIPTDADLPASVRTRLTNLGHQVYVDEYGLGNAHGLTIEYDESGRPVRFAGGADPRAEGVARGY